LEELVGTLTGSAKLAFRLCWVGAGDQSAVYIAPTATRVKPYNRSIRRDIRSRANRTAFGALLESFVFSELLKLSAWAEEHVTPFHYRDRLEVDFVLENSAGEVIGIDVKSAATVTRRDFVLLRGDRVGGREGLRWECYAQLVSVYWPAVHPVD
jgi:hypothetical protein